MVNESLDVLERYLQHGALSVSKSKIHDLGKDIDTFIGFPDDPPFAAKVSLFSDSKEIFDGLEVLYPQDLKDTHLRFEWRQINVEIISLDGIL
jgi:hypothetical protein